MNRLWLRNLLLFLLSGFFVLGCQAKDTIITPTESALSTSIPSTTPSLTPKSTSTIALSQTPLPPCVDTEISSPMTESQIEYFQSHAYNFLYSSDEQSIDNIYSVNRADIVCSQYYGSPSGNFTVWKVVSGFIIDVNQPDENLYYPGGTNTAGGSFVNIYAKARFISQEGSEHDYWLQLQGNPPGYWFQLVQWDESISESRNQPGLTAMEILATGKNGDGSSSFIDANMMIPNGLLKAKDQFVAVLYAGYINDDEGVKSSDLLEQFANAVEGKAKFPIAPEGFFLSVQAMIVPSRP